MQLGRIVRDYDRSYQEALAFLSSRTEVVQTDQQVLAWEDGPSLLDLSTHLSEVLGSITIEQTDYLGAPYSLNPNRRSATIKVKRSLSRHRMIETVLRCWGANGPITAGAANLPDLLVSVAEQGGTYPIPSAMATALLVESPDLDSDTGAIIKAIVKTGYEHLWAIGFSALR
jgi:hypothetical protein